MIGDRFAKPGAEALVVSGGHEDNGQRRCVHAHNQLLRPRKEQVRVPVTTNGRRGGHVRLARHLQAHECAATSWWIGRQQPGGDVRGSVGTSGSWQWSGRPRTRRPPRQRSALRSAQCPSPNTVSTECPTSARRSGAGVPWSNRMRTTRPHTPARRREAHDQTRGARRLAGARPRSNDLLDRSATAMRVGSGRSHFIRLSRNDALSRAHVLRRIMMPPAWSSNHGLLGREGTGPNHRNRTRSNLPPWASAAPGIPHTDGNTRTRPWASPRRR
jgi:hypothetical protein